MKSLLCNHRTAVGPLDNTLRLLLLTAIIAVEAVNSEINCFSSGGEKKFKKEFADDGGMALITCYSECFEAAKKPFLEGRLLVHMYESGCGECPELPFEAECRKCKSTLCNDAIARHLSDFHLPCYNFGTKVRAKEVKDIDYGNDRVWCAGQHNDCYWSRTDTTWWDEVTRIEYSRTIFKAGCSNTCEGKADNCVRCSDWLCNVPVHLTKSFAAKIANYKAAKGARPNGGGEDSSGPQENSTALEGRSSGPGPVDPPEDDSSPLATRPTVCALAVGVLATTLVGYGWSNSLLTF